MSKLDEMLLLATAITPLTTGILQVIKKATNIDKRFLPLLSIFVGLGLGALATFIEPVLVNRLWIGLISGLASVGLFEYVNQDNKSYNDKKNNGGKK